MIINFIDMGLATFWQEPTTAKIKGKFEKEIAAKYYLMGKGLSAENAETYIDKISNKLESLSDEHKNAAPSIPASMDGKSSDYSSYQVRIRAIHCRDHLRRAEDASTAHI